MRKESKFSLHYLQTPPLVFRQVFMEDSFSNVDKFGLQMTVDGSMVDVRHEVAHLIVNRRVDLL